MIEYIYLFILLLLVVLLYKQMREPFVSVINDYNTPETSHTVNLPINTTYSCSNMCGPLARCSITGEQCTSDVVCFGCQPKVGLNGAGSSTNTSKKVRGQNDAGKLTAGNTPTYSFLTTDIGTQAKFFSTQNMAYVPQAYFGKNTWRNKFDSQEHKFFEANKIQKSDEKNLLSYPHRETTTGMFSDIGPLAANAYISEDLFM